MNVSGLDWISSKGTKWILFILCGKGFNLWSEAKVSNKLDVKPRQVAVLASEIRLSQVQLLSMFIASWS